MSKKLIAGAGVVASFAVALAPLATFAADATWNSDEHTDTLSVTVLPTCAFGAATATPITGVSHNASPTAANGPTVGTPDPAINGASNIATWVEDANKDNLGMTPDAAGQTEHATTDTAYYRIFAGTADSEMGTTILKVVCNQNNGYKIFTEAANLSEGTETINVVAAGAATATATGYTIAVADTDSRGATLTQVTDTTKTATVVNDAASNAAGDTYTYTYGIGIAPTQKAATYTGNVVYTLVQQLGD